MVVAEHALVSVVVAAAVVEHVPALVVAAEAEVAGLAEEVPEPPGQVAVVAAVPHRGPVSIKVVRADPPRRHGPAFPIRRRLRVRVVARSAMPVRGHRSPINRAVSVVEISEWVIGPA